MPNKSVPLSVRLSPSEAEFVHALNIDEAQTPSEKLRAIISAAKKRRLGTEDFGSALQLAQDSLDPTLRIIRTNENKHGIHSELISRVGDWLPECMAYLTACNGTELDLSEEELRKIEISLVNRVSVLMQSILQMAITRHGPCYEPEYLRDAIAPVIELAEIVGKQST